MTNERIEEIMEKAVRDVYAAQSEEVSAKIGQVDSAVQTAIDGINFSEVDGMTEDEAYEFYADWVQDGIDSVK